MSERKKQHIELAFKSQLDILEKDKRFVYEPLLSGHNNKFKEITFLDKKFQTPLWASSMTGGTELAGKINENIARVCKDFKMGMGLGSCRIILDDNSFLNDFDVRKFLGSEQPLYANLGIAQIDSLLNNNKLDKVKRLIDQLQADGLIVHVNPLQEAFQPEGDLISKAPINIIEELIPQLDFPLIVKEVGQGFGFESLKRLLELPIKAIEFGAFGGTNFSLLELLRGSEEFLNNFRPFAYIGQSAEQMVDSINLILDESNVRCNEVIISGGIKNFLDGFYLMEKCSLNSIYGQASTILNYAKESYESLYRFVELQSKGLQIAKSFLRINQDKHD